MKRIVHSHPTISSNFDILILQIADSKPAVIDFLKNTEKPRLSPAAFLKELLALDSLEIHGSKILRFRYEFCNSEAEFDSYIDNISLNPREWYHLKFKF